MASGKLSKLKEAVAKKKAALKSPVPIEPKKAATEKNEKRPAPLPEAKQNSAKPIQNQNISPQQKYSKPSAPAPDPGKIELIQISPPAPSLNTLIMSDSRVAEMSDKLVVFRNVLRRYGEIEKGRRAADIVDEEVKKLISKNKKK